ncbi:lasso peptide biosynthesis PqqD family chaperone [Allosalinactinospora lopnorensis]|uniref:lasso peptide biosynthesis PqqD family chaperone n=1 Tax=Allosalinactinospora lopnorensis TaxID=1352348 RepID=UPI000623FCF4|nr:lasso peptide biosynthesis PqqD family chaperone [Allosalinactinospora lopnorensis]
MTVLAPHVTLTPTNDGAMLLDERTGRMFHLNRSGYEVLTAMLDGGTDAAATRLCDRYGIDDDRAWRDAEAVLTDLTTRGLITSETAT